MHLTFHASDFEERHASLVGTEAIHGVFPIEQNSLGPSASWRGIGDTRTQLAPLSLQEVLQVTLLPFMQALQTSTHWLRLRASNSLYRWEMQRRC
jgi:hypothetical protein